MTPLTVDVAFAVPVAKTFTLPWAFSVPAPAMLACAFAKLTAAVRLASALMPLSETPPREGVRSVVALAT